MSGGPAIVNVVSFMRGGIVCRDPRFPAAVQRSICGMRHTYCFCHRWQGIIRLLIRLLASSNVRGATERSAVLYHFSAWWSASGCYRIIEFQDYQIEGKIMKKLKKALIALLFSIFVIVSFVGTGCAQNGPTAAAEVTGCLLERDDWSDDVKTALNNLLGQYGNVQSDPAETSYVVFDFDNTCSIFDMEEQTVVYQLQTMAFEIKPDQMKEILLTGIPEPDENLASYGLFDGSFRDLADDIAASYEAIWNHYGPFTCRGVDAQTAKKLAEDPFWSVFAVKVFQMYDSLDVRCSHDVSYPWMTYLFAGMTDEDLYDLTMRALKEYSSKDTSEETWTTSEEIQTKTGHASYTWTSGASVSENINELWRVLDERGIDVWVCSASVTGVIRAAIDYFDLHPFCTGMLGMTDQTDEEGRFVNEYDYETGCGYYAAENGWVRMDRPTKTQTQGKGKVTAIVNAIAPEYGGQGPVAGFMDSTGDFNFCTEFDSLKLVVCFNRATRAVTEGGGLIAEIAIYQRDTLGYDLAKANEAGDTLYVLQGRDENGQRSLRNSNSTMRYEKTKETLFKNEDNFTQLKRFEEEGLSTKETIDKWARIQTGEENGLGFDTGFLQEYDGYHSLIS